MYEQILNRIRTREEKEFLIDEIRLLLDSFYEEKGAGFESSLKARVRAWLAEIILEELSKNSLSPENYLDGLRNRLDNLKELTLTLAFEPTEATIDKFFFFIKEKVGENIILDLQYDPKVLGGAVIVHKGEYRDFSLKRLYDLEFSKKQKELLTVIYKTPKNV